MAESSNPGGKNKDKENKAFEDGKKAFGWKDKNSNTKTLSK